MEEKQGLKQGAEKYDGHCSCDDGSSVCENEILHLKALSLKCKERESSEILECSSLQQETIKHSVTLFFQVKTE